MKIRDFLTATGIFLLLVGASNSETSLRGENEISGVSTVSLVLSKKSLFVETMVKNESSNQICIVNFYTYPIFLNGVDAASAFIEDEGKRFPHFPNENLALLMGVGESHVFRSYFSLKSPKQVEIGLAGGTALEQGKLNLDFKKMMKIGKYVFITDMRKIECPSRFASAAVPISGAFLHVKSSEIRKIEDVEIHSDLVSIR